MSNRILLASRQVIGIQQQWSESAYLEHFSWSTFIGASNFPQSDPNSRYIVRIARVVGTKDPSRTMVHHIFSHPLPELQTILECFQAKNSVEG
jgi:hypothetical protein